MERDPGRSPDLRAGDADRARTVELLRRHHADGRLSAEGLAERSGQAEVARTLGDLDALVADLPALPAAARPAAAPWMPPWPQGQNAARRVFYRALFTYVVVNPVPDRRVGVR